MTEQKFAVLIDADNVPYSHVKEMMEEIAKYGTPTIKRIYGDWTKTNASGWKKVLLENAITPIQQYSYTSGKNSSDSALIIDAMDILYAEKVDGFCIVSSDSDFTRLATRLREAGMTVLGLGEKKTPQPFIAACNKFIYLEILKKGNVKPKPTGKAASATSPKVTPEPEPETVNRVDEDIIRIITESVEELADEDGWTFLGSLGHFILRKKPDFDPRNYGFTKLLQFIKSLNRFEIEAREVDQNNIRHIYLRLK